MTTTTNTPVTVIGLGLMGQSLARAFLTAGHPTTIWNRTASKADALVADGAHYVKSVADALDASPLVVVCVSDYAAMHEALDPHVAYLDGRLLLNLTSGDSALARETATWAEQHGAHYLDGAIMAVPPAIGTPEAVILHSGPESRFEAHKATLAALGTVSHVGTDHGLASLYDVAGLAMMWSVLNAWLQGTAMLRTAGVDAATFAPFAQQIATGVAGWLPGYAKQVDNDSFPAEVSALETDVAAMEHLVAESEAVGVSAELPRLIKSIADRAIAAGHGGEQYPVLIEEFRKPAAG